MIFAGLILVGFVNGISENISTTMTAVGAGAAIANTFGISIIVWCALCVGIMLLLSGTQKRMWRSDYYVASGALLAFLMPVVPLSWLTIAALAIYILHTSPRSPPVQRGAWILLALTVPMFWARLLFAAVNESILRADAAIVGWLMGAPSIGNTIQLPDGSGYLWIAPACSSLANVSLAVLCWVTVVKALDRPRASSHLGWLGLACAAVVTINVTRISLIGFYPHYYDLIHGGVGAAIASWLSLGATAAICLFGVRGRLPARNDVKMTLSLHPLPAACLGLALAASVFLKLPGMAQLAAPAMPATTFPDQVGRLLADRGFQVSQAIPDGDLAWVSGHAGECRVRVTTVVPQGWHRSLLREIAGRQQLVYIFDGAIHPEQPIIQTRAYYYWSKLNRYFGRSIDQRAVFAVISTPACRDLPLHDLAALSR